MRSMPRDDDDGGAHARIAAAQTFGNGLERGEGKGLEGFCAGRRQRRSVDARVACADGKGRRRPNTGGGWQARAIATAVHGNGSSDGNASPVAFPQ